MPDHCSFFQLESTDRLKPTIRIFHWLKLALQDFCSRPYISLFYGLGFFVISWLVISFLWFTGLAWMLLPAISGALLVGPIIAVGLYQISRTHQHHCQCSVAAPTQIALIGGILMILLLVWLRAATILFAIFYGLRPFPGLLEILSLIFTTPHGLALLFFGTMVGGLFAAFTFAITVFSIPMLVNQEVDAFTAMGRSLTTCLQNLKLTIVWGVMVTLLTIIGFLTGLVGMIVIFPLLGFATWHAYDDVFQQNTL
ncbi:MAG: DUF2189 domain-containing protein [Hyphomicrobiales bacterium]